MKFISKSTQTREDFISEDGKFLLVIDIDRTAPQSSQYMIIASDPVREVGIGKDLAEALENARDKAFENVKIFQDRIALLNLMIEEENRK